MNRFKLVTLIEISFLTAFALILDMVIPSIKPIPSISINISMVPIFLLAFRWGVKGSMIGGFLWGMLQIALGQAWILTPLQAFIEYFIAFAFIGFAGFFYQIIQRSLQTGDKSGARIWIVLAILIGSAARYFWHFIAGVFFFAEYAPDTMSPVLFSFLANGASMLGSAILSAIIVVLVLSAAPQLVMNKQVTAASSK